MNPSFRCQDRSVLKPVIVFSGADISGSFAVEILVTRWPIKRGVRGDTRRWRRCGIKYVCVAVRIEGDIGLDSLLAALPRGVFSRTTPNETYFIHKKPSLSP